MCGRYNLRTSVDKLVDAFAALPSESLDTSQVGPRFNIAPTQSVLAIRAEDRFRVLSELRWGLIPFWAKDISIGNRMINARGETVADKPAFRAAFRRRRCLVLADGFYEWKSGSGRTKQPYHIQLRNRHTIAFAGLWEAWTPSEAKPVESCTIVTTEPNSMMSDLHERMPVILREQDYDLWLDPRNENLECLRSMIGPYPSEEMEAYAVSTFVNNPRHDREECIEPLECEGP